MPVIQFYAEERRNLVKSVLLIGLFVVLMGAFGFLVDTLFEITPWATAIFLGIALLQVLIGLLSGPSLVLSSMGAQPIRPEQEAEHLELAHIVEELTIASGLPSPKTKCLRLPCSGQRRQGRLVSSSSCSAAALRSAGGGARRGQ